MKLAKLWYYCGLGLIITGIASIIYGILGDNLVYGIGRGVFGLLWGCWWMRIGSRQMREAKGIETEQTRQLDAFVKENCIGCRFADKDAIQSGGKWCTRPNPPECDKQYCYSREVEKEGGKCLTHG